MEVGKQRPIESMEQARDWERLFIGEIKAGRDPRIKPAATHAPADLQHVAGFLDAYFERHAKPSGIRSLSTVAGHIKVLQRYFGDLPVKALEDPDVINRFKTESITGDASRCQRFIGCWPFCVRRSIGAKHKGRA